MVIKIAWLLMVLTGLSLPASAAETLRLMMPAACTLGEQCWIVNHVDMAPETGEAKDFTCGPRTYDGHEGTDFGLKDMKMMKEGVSVLAAADGKVLRVRDNMPDAQATQVQIDRMLEENKGCGNGVLVEHSEGWQTIYCHLKQASVVVKPGDAVTKGQKLAEVGQSGAAEFPHLHFGVFQNSKTIDPFSGSGALEGCGHIKESMWEYGLRLDYEPLAVFAAGFTTGVPDFDVIRADTTSISKTSPAIDALTFWIGLYGVRDGDRVRIDILSPDGTIWATRELVQEDDKARQFYYVGRRVSDPLIPGNYKGVARIERTIKAGSDETLSRTAERSITVLNPVSRDNSGVMLP